MNNNFPPGVKSTDIELEETVYQTKTYCANNHPCTIHVELIGVDKYEILPDDVRCDECGDWLELDPNAPIEPLECLSGTFSTYVG